MSNRKQDKEQECYYVEVLKSVFKGFPNGEIIADENQERPDVVVANGQMGLCLAQSSAGKIGDATRGLAVSRRDSCHRPSVTVTAQSIHTHSLETILFL